MTLEAKFRELVEIMTRLRGPGGCPWDREQTPESLRKYIIEEAHEAVEAIESGDPEAVAEELGDLLLQIVFQAEIARESGSFDIERVIEHISAKLVRRHPHIFGDAVATTPAEVLQNWEQIKRGEKGRKRLLHGIPTAMSALRRAHRVSQRAASVGFDWPDVSGVRAKLEEELREMEEAIAAANEKEIAAELGDVLFSLVNLARHVGVDAEDALNGTVRKFMRRFDVVEARLEAQGRTPHDAGLEELEELWQAAKLEDDGSEF